MSRALAGGSVSLKTAVSVAAHALLIQQMREMVQAIMRTDIADMHDIVARVIHKITARVTKLVQRGLFSTRCLEAAEVHAIKSVLKILEGTTFFDHEADVTASGSAAVVALRQAVFGVATGVGEPESLDALAFGSMDKLRAFHTACLWLLLQSLRPSNCLRMMRLGQALALQTLEDQAFLYSITNLRQVLEGPGREDWLQLEVEDVVALLSNTHVQLSNELEVWDALSAWLSFSPADRAGDAVGELLGACLRLEDMSVLQLQTLRQTQLVSSCPAAASLVSAFYTRQMVSSVHQSRGADAMEDAGGAGDAHHSHGHGGTSPLPTGLLNISPDEEQLSKKPRLGQEAIAAQVVGNEVAQRVDAQPAPPPGGS